MNVRELLPVRRTVTTRNPKGTNWSEHKPDLKIDFHSHCGYCGSYDGYRHTYYEVDHFVPKSLFELTGHISYCQYDNLVYSCKFCNNKKLAQWPSNDEAIHNLNDEGFVDPCDNKYDENVYRTSSGSIRWKTKLGKWMVETGFKFDERDYGIKLLWELNQLRKSIDKLAEELVTHDSNAEEYKSIYLEMGKITVPYYLYQKELINYYNAL